MMLFPHTESSALIIQCQKPRTSRRTKTDPISMEYFEWRLRSGCPLCMKKLEPKRKPDGGVFYVCPANCLADDGNYYYIGIHGEKKYTLQ